MCNCFGYDSKLYRQAVDNYWDNIAVIEMLKEIASYSDVTEDMMRLFLEYAPSGGMAVWGAFEYRAHAKNAPEGYCFRHYFNEIVHNGLISEERIILQPTDIQYTLT